MVATLTALEAEALIAATGVLVIDVRDQDEYEAGHLPAARSVPLDAIRADAEAALGGATQGILFVCARGVRSLNAAKLADRLGFANVYNLDGGTHAWAAAGLPVVATQRVAA